MGEEFDKLLNLDDNPIALVNLNKLHVVEHQNLLPSTLVNDSLNNNSDDHLNSSYRNSMEEQPSENAMDSSVENGDSSKSLTRNVWPQSFILKDELVSPSLLQKLNNSVDLTTGDFTALISCLFYQCSRVT